MKYLPVAASALISAAALALTSWLGTAALTVVVCLICAVVALGWPQLMGVTARGSLSAVIAAAGIVAAVGASIAAAVDTLFFWSSVSLAFGIIAVFLIQVLRGTGRPHRLESTLGACAGVVVTTTAAGWVAGLRYPASLAEGGEQSDVMGFLSVRGLMPYEDWGMLGVTGPGGELSVVGLAAATLFIGSLIACLPWRDALSLPLVVLGSAAAAVGLAVFWGELTLLFAGIIGLSAGALLACFRRFLIQQGAPSGLLSGTAVGAAPIAATGVLIYFTERVLLV
ncbi:hypothetical protein [Nesterenkonia cremea]|uniref:Uncharacterized protein n=1 Tax=Nesterenkonia cremea TaxID=1882340 RepID=A0A917ARN9_9MICC|nr:hypothetical protein [Nesterenkonia cremea]GGE69254.1 hypothetical protein GCM10011401_15780 [Nesterenkonia cremea]